LARVDDPPGGFMPLKLRWEWSETLEIVMQ
jgi:hypothetical protein